MHLIDNVCVCVFSFVSFFNSDLYLMYVPRTEKKTILKELFALVNLGLMKLK